MGIFTSKEAKFKRAVTELVATSLGDRGRTEWANEDLYTDLEAVQAALRKSGMESCNFLVGIDFTNSNRRQGERSFHGQCLHALNSPHGPNPYEMVIDIVGKALAPFDEDHLIPTFVFGDVQTKAHSVRQIGATQGCRGIEEVGGVLDCYRREVANACLSGPTTFAPLIDQAVEIVRKAGNQLHILCIIADGVVPDVENCLRDTRQAIARAASVPLSIVMVGVGDGPWDDMVVFDDGLPDRNFDNFQFVPFSSFHELFEHHSQSEQRRVLEAAFAVCALQEVPAQFTAMKQLGLLGSSERRSQQERSREDEPPSKRLKA